MCSVGLENMHALTDDGRRYQHRVEISDVYGKNYYETYGDFSIGGPRDFVLHVKHAAGTAGNVLY